jgi:hypothetical protein
MTRRQKDPWVLLSCGRLAIVVSFLVFCCAWQRSADLVRVDQLTFPATVYRYMARSHGHARTLQQKAPVASQLGALGGSLPSFASDPG